MRIKSWKSHYWTLFNATNLSPLCGYLNSYNSTKHIMRLTVLLIALFALFHQPIFAQKKDTPSPQQKVVSGIVLLNDKTVPDGKAILASLRTKWKIKTDSSSVADKTIVFSVQNATVMIAFLDYPVPPAEIRTAAKFSWLWRTAEQEAGAHQAQAVISVIGEPNKTLDLYKIFTRVTGGVLENTKSAGFYMGERYLLLSRDFYLAAAVNMRDNQTIPLYCWVYFGMIQEKELSNGYTYGLQEFGLQEMEVVDSKQSLQDVHSVLYDAALTVIQYNMKLKDGQSFTTTEGQKLTVHLSKAAFQQGETLKLDF